MHARTALENGSYTPSSREFSARPKMHVVCVRRAMNFTRGRCGAFLVATGLATATSHVHAAEISWDAPAGCPDREALRWQIEQSLGTKLEEAAPLRFAAKLQVNASKRWVVILDVLGESRAKAPQRRELEAATCDEAARAARVAIALALGADAAAANAERAPLPPRKPDVPPDRRAEAVVAPDPARSSAEQTPKRTPESPQPIGFAAQLGPILDLGSLPGLAAGVRVSALAGYRSFGVQLGGVVLPSRTKEVSGEPSGTFSLVAASVSVCGIARLAATRVRTCAGSELGELSGQGYRTTRAWRGRSGWVAPFVDVSASWRLWDESLRLFGTGTLALPLVRKQFSVDNFGQVHQPGTIVARFGVGLELLWQ